MVSTEKIFGRFHIYLFYQRIHVFRMKQNNDPVWEQAQNEHQDCYRQGFSQVKLILELSLLCPSW